MQGYVKPPEHFSPVGQKFLYSLTNASIPDFFNDIRILTDQPSALFKQLILRNHSMILITIIYKIFTYNI
ncbi:hypothetical protein KM92DES2_11976 [uncultured Desulfovibrio sp.]|uniref:Uncharacterized protein n=1 Tax=uncultured Desulfovibrio sp. TaxID=167968 RepID=A0A212JZC7_9BACT|nr:hypothetical protein KM92DES2_11976 [uncultured Desulfovibrio sp.]